MRRRRSSGVVVLVVVVIGIGMLATASPCFAQGGWTNTNRWISNTGGGYLDRANWDNHGPDANDDIIFARGAGVTYTVNFPGNLIGGFNSYQTRSLRIGSNNVTFTSGINAGYTATAGFIDPISPGILIGQIAGENAILNTNISWAGQAATIGQLAGASGTLNINSGGLFLNASSNFQFEATVGYQGTGALNLNTGGQLHMNAADADMSIGDQAGANGSISVNGAGSLLSIPHAGTTAIGFWLGLGGNGSMNITNGGRVNLGKGAAVGAFTGATGAVTVTGANSNWSVGKNLVLASAGGAGSLSITNGGTVTVGGDILDGGGTATSGPGASTLTLDGGTLDMQGHKLGGAGAQAINVLLLDSGTLKNVAEINGGAGFTKHTTGTLTLAGNNTYTGGTNARNGTLAFATSHTTGSGINIVTGTVRLERSSATPNNVLIKTGGIANFAGFLDVTDNKLLVTNGVLGAPTNGQYSGITGQIQTGRNAVDGSGAPAPWTGRGIMTSMPDAAQGRTGLAVATADEAGYVGRSFGGVTVTNPGDVLVMYTYDGDANLDGQISGDDYGYIDFAILVPGSYGYANGDFNLDGTINGDDYGSIDFNILAQGARFPTTVASAGGGAVSAVPEPTACPLAILVIAAASARRGRRRRHAQA